MLRQVLRELRYHPSRFIATTIAIAISVAFMAGSSILVATENNSVQREQSARYGNADVIVSITTDNRQNVEDAGKLIAGTPGVAASAPSLTSTLALKHGQTSLYADMIGLPAHESLRNVRVAEVGRRPPPVSCCSAEAPPARSASGSAAPWRPATTTTPATPSSG